MADIVPSRFMLVGVEQQAKAYVEDYANADAGAPVTAPVPGGPLHRHLAPVGTMR